MGEHVDEQGRNTFERHPAYDGGDEGAPVATERPEPDEAGVRTAAAPAGGATARSRAATLVGVLGVLISLVTLAAGYSVLRWAGDPLTWFVLATGLGLLVLSGLAVVAGRVGGLATFVVIALLLPFVTTLAGVAALGQRVSDGLEGLFGDSDDTTLSWGTGTDTDDEEKSSPAEEAVALGEEGVANDFTVTVSGVECTSRLKDAVENPERWEDPDAPELVDAKAPAGKQLCVVSSSWTNTSTKPGSVSGWTSFGSLVTADGTQYSAVSDDSELSRTLTEKAGYDGDVLNPGDQAEVRSVFTVNEGLDLTHAVVEQFDLETPEVWFSLR